MRFKRIECKSFNAIFLQDPFLELELEMQEVERNMRKRTKRSSAYLCFECHSQSLFPHETVNGMEGVVGSERKKRKLFRDEAASMAQNDFLLQLHHTWKLRCLVSVKEGNSCTEETVEIERVEE